MQEVSLSCLFFTFALFPYYIDGLFKTNSYSSLWIGALHIVYSFLFQQISMSFMVHSLVRQL